MDDCSYAGRYTGVGGGVGFGFFVSFVSFFVDEGRTTISSATRGVFDGFFSRTPGPLDAKTSEELPTSPEERAEISK